MTRVAVAAGGAGWEADVLRRVEAAPALQLVRRCVDISELLALAETGGAEVALVDPFLSGLDADAVHRLHGRGVRVAAVGADLEDVADRGVQIVVDPDRVATIDGIRPTPVAPPAPGGRLVVVWGPGGAPGRSTLALSVAAAAAARGQEAVLIDADTYGGSLGQALGVLDDVSGLMAACRAANRGDLAGIGEHVLRVEDGLSLLTGLPRADMWPHVRTGALEAVLRHLRARHPVLVADVGAPIESDGAGRGRNDATLHLLAEADDVVVVGRADPVGLARLVRGLSELAEATGRHTPIVVVNQSRGTLGWSESDVRSTVSRLTGVDPAAFLPWDQVALDTAMMLGRTPRSAAPSSPFVAGVETLTTGLLTASPVLRSPRP